jgi:hypothetical protein
MKIGMIKNSFIINKNIVTINIFFDKCYYSYKINKFYLSFKNFASFY